MCGIVGVVHRDSRPASPVVVHRMADAVAHRGPDGEGFYFDDSVGFGHRRLAVIDLTEAGHQPMATSDGNHVLIYNGETYNFQELRVSLEALGHRFYSQTDSEVVLKALAQHGLDALPMLNGMFAFAWYDRAERRVVLARDRFGVKPLYWATAGDTLVFGSEIKALLAHPEFEGRLDQRGLVEYLTFQNFLGERTLFEGVSIVPPGTWMSIPLDRSRPIKTHRYWDFDFEEPDVQAAHGDYVEELDRLFQSAVSRQLVADVPVGAYLSGGMDTSAITSVASGQLEMMSSFTVGFDLSSASGLELAFDERAAAERMSYLAQTEHYEMVLKAGDMERCLPELTAHLEEPRVGQSYPNWYAARLASRFSTVTLSGAGGDEIFAGYPWRYYRALVNENFDDYLDKYFEFWQRLVPTESMGRLFEPLSSEAQDVNAREIFGGVFSDRSATDMRPEDYINQSLYFEAKTFLHGLLVVEDKLSMAHGLETRVPFLDNDLVDFAMRVPVASKLSGVEEALRLNENTPGHKARVMFSDAMDGKVLLRDAMARHVPLEVTKARKQGFSAPDASWFRGESIDYVRRRLLGSNARIFDFLDRDEVHSLVDDHTSGRENRRLLIWSLLTLECWCEEFIS